MGANKIVNMLINIKDAASNQQNFTELDLLAPSPGVVDAIKKAGGKIGKHWKKQLCHSDTCDHNDHAEYQRYLTVCIPQSWILKNPGIDEINKFFFINYDDDKDRTPLLIFWNKMPILIYKIDEEDVYMETYYADACSIPPPDPNMCDDEYYHFLVNNLNKSEGS